MLEARYIIVVGLRRLWHRCFPVNFAKFLKTTFFTEHLQWLLFTIKKVCRSFIFFFFFIFASTFTFDGKEIMNNGKIFVIFKFLLILFSEERNNLLNGMGMQFDRERADYERKLNEANAVVSQFLLMFLKLYIHRL